MRQQGAVYGKRDFLEEGWNGICEEEACGDQAV